MSVRHAAVLVAALGLATSPLVAHAQGVEPRGVRTILIGGSNNFPQEEPSLLPLPDEQLLERARTQLRGGQFTAAERTIADLETRHPDDLDVILVRAEWMQRREPPPGVGTWLDGKAKKSNVAKALKERPFRAGFWSRFAADSYAAAGKIPEARTRALAAWEASPEQASWARVRLEQWSDGDLAGLARDVSKLASKRPERTDLALEAARFEAAAGKPEIAIARIEKAEAATAKASVAATRDGGAAPIDASPPGSLLWQLALSLRSRDEVSGRAADSALVALATGPYDADLKERAVSRLFEDREANPGPGSEWMEGTMRFLTPEKSPPVRPSATAERDRLLALESVWRGLPADAENVRRGLDLAERLERVGATDASRRVARDASAMAGAVPGATDDPEVAQRLALAAGEEALVRGDLAAATRAFDAVSAGSGLDALREEATFLACEARFYAGAFDTAAAAYDAFARTWPGSVHANDALERAYLIENGGPTAPGLAAFADASRLARTGKPDEALGRAKEAQVAAAGGPAWSHAALLVASLLETKGDLAGAVAVTREVPKVAPEDRLAPTAMRRTGDLLLAAGDAPAALAQYEELLVRYPRSWLAPETRRRVQSLRSTRGGTP